MERAQGVAVPIIWLVIADVVYKRENSQNTTEIYRVVKIQNTENRGRGFSIPTRV